MEGAKEGKWIVIDYGDVIVHVFLEEMRRYYNLDELWSSARLAEIPSEYLWESKGQ
jgi:ribosome-associated protein